MDRTTFTKEFCSATPATFPALVAVAVVVLVAEGGELVVLEALELVASEVPTITATAMVAATTDANSHQ
jgi:hypothetical protein